MEKIKIIILKAIDVLYLPIVRRYVPLQLFRYAVCGGANMALDILLYFFFFHVVLHKEDLHLFSLTISPEIAAFLMVFPIVFFVGVWFGRNITFQASKLSLKTQSFRYLSVVAFNIAFKYFGLKWFVDVLGVFPSISNALLTIISVFFSYILQKNYTFYIKKIK